MAPFNDDETFDDNEAFVNEEHTYCAGDDEKSEADESELYASNDLRDHDHELRFRNTPNHYYNDYDLWDDLQGDEVSQRHTKTIAFRRSRFSWIELWVKVLSLVKANRESQAH